MLPTLTHLPAPPHLVWRRTLTRWLLFASIQRTSHPLQRDDAQGNCLPIVSEEDAFATFFQQYGGQIARYLWRMLGDEQTAYDLCQETFLRAWEHFAEVSAYPYPGTWLFRVATNLALDARRRRAAPVGAAGPLDEALPLGEDFAQHHAAQETIRQILQAMPAKQRALLVLREVYGFSTIEAAEILRLSPAAASRMLSRARADFRARYQRKEQQP